MFPKKHDFVKALVKRFPDITTVTFSVNRTPEMLLLGENNEVLYGEGYITDILCGKKIQNISALVLSDKSRTDRKAVRLRYKGGEAHEEGRSA